MSTVRLKQLTKHYGDVKAVDGIDLYVDEGEFISLLGPSGCGKTTSLRMIAGLIKPDFGSVEIGGNIVDHIPAYKRNIGMVFQDYALFPHMSVFDNIAFGLEMRRVPKAECQEKVKEALEIIRLPELVDRYPRQLSGGQQQRIALARALAIEPAVLLLDEPLSNLDLKLRIQMRVELKQIQRTLGITTVFVTHDQGEALNLSDRVIVMESGKVVQDGPPIEIYERPANRFVASFIGESNFINGTVIECENGYAEVQVGAEHRLQGVADVDLKIGQSVLVLVRPEKIQVVDPSVESINTISGSISHIAFSGSSTRYVVQIVTGEELKVDLSFPVHSLEDEISLSWEPESSLVLPAEKPEPIRINEKK